MLANAADTNLHMTQQLSTPQGQQQQQRQQQDTVSTSQASNTGVSTEVRAGDVNFNTTTPANQKVEYSGTQTIKNVPSVSGPALTTSNDTCMGSTSGSVNIAGLGIGGGSTWTDTNCKRLKNARELWNMGMKGAGMALMCMDAENRDALTSSGYQCPQTKQEKAEADRKTGNPLTSSQPDMSTSAFIGR